MRVIQRGPAILGDRVLRDFARSLRAADLAEATRRGYAADLGRFRAWIEDSRLGFSRNRASSTWVAGGQTPAPSFYSQFPSFAADFSTITVGGAGVKPAFSGVTRSVSSLTM